MSKFAENALELNDVTTSGASLRSVSGGTSPLKGGNKVSVSGGNKGGKSKKNSSFK